MPLRETGLKAKEIPTLERVGNMEKGERVNEYLLTHLKL
jgi:hypothetical protein